ncbi:hypothetical protein SKAU_G00292680 [Synaphobranchus kaupii]|uniref:Deoxyribonuclease n=1 Tax=Synaphobranchus kaupii TaxID=118154 RepID=A0A9Q1EU73_SYNKA|nr:hypothetical protein SKAU_G00292680 [Synaphobranchus kaupii]
MKIICAFLLILRYVEPSTGSLLIGAFNIQSFGRTKADGPAMKPIVEIVIRYDIVVIQEVRDNDLYATNKLMNEVNKVSPSYSYEVSQPLGQGTYKERYLYIYRNTKVSVAKTFQYPATDTFSRAPFVVMFTYPNSVVREFALIPQHTCPRKAKKEIDALYDVALDIKNQWTTDNIILLGDFNAGCTYVKNTDWPDIRLYTDKNFHWLIPDTADTTVRHNMCPYDRIVARPAMIQVVVPGSAVVYDYMIALNLNQSMALAVSDHFPVEVQLQ